MSQHTPGPWTAAKVRDIAFFEIRGGAEIIGSFFASQTRDTNKANVLLLAASPTMLYALEALLDSEASSLADGGSILGDDLRTTARAAIAKARGAKAT